MIELDSMEVKWKGLGNRITNGEEKGKNARDKERRGEERVTEKTSSSNLSIFIHTTLETHEPMKYSLKP